METLECSDLLSNFLVHRWSKAWAPGCVNLLPRLTRGRRDVESRNLVPTFWTVPRTASDRVISVLKRNFQIRAYLPLKLRPNIYQIYIFQSNDVTYVLQNEMHINQVSSVKRNDCLLYP